MVMRGRGGAGGHEQPVPGEQTRRRGSPEENTPRASPRGQQEPARASSFRHAKSISTKQPISDRRARSCLFEEGGIFRTCNAQYTKHITEIKKGFSLCSSVIPAWYYSVTRDITTAPVINARKVSEDGEPDGPSDWGSRSSHCLRDTSSHLQEVHEEDLSDNARGRGQALPRIV